MAANGALRAVLEARSVAVVGASRKPGTPGNRMVKELLVGGFSGELAAVNRAEIADHAQRHAPLRIGGRLRFSCPNCSLRAQRAGASWSAKPLMQSSPAAGFARRLPAGVPRPARLAAATSRTAHAGPIPSLAIDPNSIDNIHRGASFVKTGYGRANLWARSRVRHGG